jgi:hypothetical protein
MYYKIWLIILRYSLYCIFTDKIILGIHGNSHAIQSLSLYMWDESIEQFGNFVLD